MSEKTIALLSLAVGVASLYVTIRMAKGLTEAKESADKTIASFKQGPTGEVLKFLGMS